MRLSKQFAAIAAIAMTALTVSAAYDSADARTRRASGSVATQRGVAHGQAEVRRERGSRTRDATVTGANGRTRSNHDERSWNRAEGSYTRDHTTTYNDGSQRSVGVDAQRAAPGQYSVSREVTGRNGETRTQTGDFSGQRTENGRSISGDINTTNNGQVDYNRTISHDDGVRSVNSSAVFEDGSSVSRSSQASCGDGACSSSGVVTNRNGGQTSWVQSHTRTDDGAVMSRDVTYADGTTRSVDRDRSGNGDGTGSVDRTVTGRNGETRTQTGDYQVTRTP